MRLTRAEVCSETIGFDGDAFLRCVWVCDWLRAPGVLTSHADGTETYIHTHNPLLLGEGAPETAASSWTCWGWRKAPCGENDYFLWGLGESWYAGMWRDASRLAWSSSTVHPRSATLRLMTMLWHMYETSHNNHRAICFHASQTYSSTTWGWIRVYVNCELTMSVDNVSSWG